jgi:hypothetical protein
VTSQALGYRPASGTWILAPLLAILVALAAGLVSAAAPSPVPAVPASTQVGSAQTVAPVAQESRVLAGR